MDLPLAFFWTSLLKLLLLRAHLQTQTSSWLRLCVFVSFLGALPALFVAGEAPRFSLEAQPAGVSPRLVSAPNWQPTPQRGAGPLGALCCSPWVSSGLEARFTPKRRNGTAAAAGTAKGRGRERRGGRCSGQSLARRAKKEEGTDSVKLAQTDRWLPEEAWRHLAGLPPCAALGGWGAKLKIANKKGKRRKKRVSLRKTRNIPERRAWVFSQELPASPCGDSCLLRPLQSTLQRPPRWASSTGNALFVHRTHSWCHSRYSFLSSSPALCAFTVPCPRGQCSPESTLSLSPLPSSLRRFLRTASRQTSSEAPLVFQSPSSSHSLSSGHCSPLPSQSLSQPLSQPRPKSSAALPVSLLSVLRSSSSSSSSSHPRHSVLFSRSSASGGSPSAAWALSLHREAPGGRGSDPEEAQRRGRERERERGHERGEDKNEVKETGDAAWGDYRLVTCPLFYSNARMHLGHAYSCVLADTLVRYARSRQGFYDSPLSRSEEPAGPPLRTAEPARGEDAGDGGEHTETETERETETQRETQRETEATEASTAESAGEKSPDARRLKEGEKEEREGGARGAREREGGCMILTGADEHGGKVVRAAEAAWRAYWKETEKKGEEEKNADSGETDESLAKPHASPDLSTPSVLTSASPVSPFSPCFSSAFSQDSVEAFVNSIAAYNCAMLRRLHILQHPDGSLPFFRTSTRDEPSSFSSFSSSTSRSSSSSSASSFTSADPDSVEKVERREDAERSVGRCREEAPETERLGEERDKSGEIRRLWRDGGDAKKRATPRSAHERAVWTLWRMLEEKGLIYKAAASSLPSALSSASASRGRQEAFNFVGEEEEDQAWRMHVSRGTRSPVSASLPGPASSSVSSSSLSSSLSLSPSSLSVSSSPLSAALPERERRGGEASQAACLDRRRRRESQGSEDGEEHRGEKQEEKEESEDPAGEGGGAEFYFFRLTHFKDALLQLYASPRLFSIAPASRLEEVKAFVEHGGLRDLAISRPSSTYTVSPLLHSLAASSSPASWPYSSSPVSSPQSHLSPFSLRSDSAVDSSVSREEILRRTERRRQSGNTVGVWGLRVPPVDFDDFLSLPSPFAFPSSSRSSSPFSSCTSSPRSSSCRSERNAVYVWFDAVVGYLTAAGFPDVNSRRFRALWPPSLQVLGKDILRFHGVLLPALLLGVGLPLPRRLLVHGWWTDTRNRKLSKSAAAVSLSSSDAATRETPVQERKRRDEEEEQPSASRDGDRSEKKTQEKTSLPDEDATNADGSRTRGERETRDAETPRRDTNGDSRGTCREDTEGDVGGETRGDCGKASREAAAEAGGCRRGDEKAEKTGERGEASEQRGRARFDKDDGESKASWSGDNSLSEALRRLVDLYSPDVLRFFLLHAKSPEKDMAFFVSTAAGFEKTKRSETTPRPHASSSRSPSASAGENSLSIPEVYVTLQRSVGNLLSRVLSLLWKRSGARGRLPRRPRWVDRAFGASRAETRPVEESDRRRATAETSARDVASFGRDENNERDGRGEETEAAREESEAAAREKQWLGDNAVRDKRDDGRGREPDAQEQRMWNESKGHAQEREREGLQSSLDADTSTTSGASERMKEDCQVFLKKIIDFEQDADACMHTLQFHLYTRHLLRLASEANAFIDRLAPWRLLSSSSLRPSSAFSSSLSSSSDLSLSLSAANEEARRASLETALFFLCEFLRRFARLLAPVSPGLAEKIFAQLRVPVGLRTLEQQSGKTCSKEETESAEDEQEGADMMPGGWAVETPQQMLPPLS
ncbi:tRNA ligases class I (M) protein [Toxoplasma gondii ARI]|uniref:tRNA ligases class I (M) protein n=1 Tax=Toxoplasma gondii ARI TaxID=1074872 RepID=A0A139XYE8_TOXGO|nr:tRNA ligases class I (M) protein [Toxoplasma gondii ARI]